MLVRDKRIRNQESAAQDVTNSYVMTIPNHLDYVMVVITRYMQSTMKKKEQLGRITYENNKFYTFDRNIYIFDRN